VRIQFGSQSYQHTSLPLSAQEMVNCYLEAAPPGSKSLAATAGCYGIAAISTIGTGPIRGVLSLNNRLFVVSGEWLYEAFANGGSAALGTIPGSERVRVEGDGTNLMVTTATAGYYYDGTTVSQIADSDYPVLRSLANIDGYYIGVLPDTGQFYLSLNRNPASWDGLDFATAEKYPDDLIQVIVNYGEAILLGRESGEVWVNTGASDFTLERQPTGVFEKGCSSPWGAAKADNRVFFPGHDGIVYALNGYQPERISTHAIEQAMAAAVDKEFIGQAWTEGGHSFYGLTCADFSFAYDISTGLWSRRRSFGAENWQVTHTVRCFSKQLAFSGNRMGELTHAAFAEWGEVLRMSAVSPPIYDDNKRIFHSRVELVFEQGVGLLTGQGSDPQVMLRFSDDGGRKWSNEKWRSLGATGQYRSRCIWSRLGSSRDRIYEFAVSDPVRRTLMLATTEPQGGAY
jgi:hypothetical protein